MFFHFINIYLTKNEKHNGKPESEKWSVVFSVGFYEPHVIVEEFWPAFLSNIASDISFCMALLSSHHGYHPGWLVGRITEVNPSHFGTYLDGVSSLGQDSADGSTRNFGSRVLQYTDESRAKLISGRCPGPVVAKQAQIISPPPPCLTAFYVVFVQIQTWTKFLVPFIK